MKSVLRKLYQFAQRPTGPASASALAKESASPLTVARARILSLGNRGLGVGLALWGVVLTGHAASSVQDTAAFAERWVQQHYQQPGGRVETQASPLDSRLRLAPCPVPLTARLPAGDRLSPRVSVLVQCPSTDGWTARVTVELHVYRTVLVASRPLLRGDGVAASDVHGEERDVTRLGYGYFDRMDQLHARVLAHAVMRGSVLTPSALGGRQMVRAGDQVQIVANLAGIAVRAQGTALGSGDTGGRIRVKNAASGRVIDALIQAPGEVEALP